MAKESPSKTMMDTRSEKREVFWERVALVSGGLLGGIGFGLSASFGLYLKPISHREGLKRQVISLAVGLNFLLQGLTSVGWGALADTQGTLAVLIIGALLEFLSLLATSYARSAWEFSLAIPVEGFATGALSFAIILGAVGKLVAPQRRPSSLGTAAAFVAMGNVFVPPVSFILLSKFSWYISLRWTAYGCLFTMPVLCALFGLATARLKALRAAQPDDKEASTEVLVVEAAAAEETTNPLRPDEEDTPKKSLIQTLVKASESRSYMLLFFGFFVCGFQVFFLRTHYAAYLTDKGLPPWVGAVAITLIGAGNVVGTYTAGQLATKFKSRRHQLLCAIYTLRSTLFAIIVLNDRPSIPFALIVSVLIGLLWLSTVPLTNGLVGDIVGPAFSTTLFALVFANHQVGSFLGAFLGGKIYDKTGSYTIMWWLCVLLGVAAALEHLLVDAKPLFPNGSA